MKPRAFTIIDLLVLLILLAVAGLIAIETIHRCRGSAIGIKCGVNLRQIGQAILLYTNENKGYYPRTHFVPDAPPTQYTGWQSPDPFAKNGPSANDVTAAMFMLLRTQDILPEVFVCPVTKQEPWDFENKPATQFSNFPSERFLSYSFQNVYVDRRTYQPKTVLSTSFAIAADMNPGGEALSRLTPQSPPKDQQVGNSKNHQRAGQNVLYEDGHVDWQMNSFCGTNGDCIYTVAGPNLATGSQLPRYAPTPPTINGQPQFAEDSVLLPVSMLNPHAERPSSKLAWWVGGGIILLLVALLLALRRQKRLRPR